MSATSPSRASRLRGFAYRAGAVLALFVLAGCFIDATVDANGGGTMTVKYRLTTAAQLESSKRRMQSGAVKVVSATVSPDKWATFQLQFDDITKLGTIDFFSKAKFSLTGDKEKKTLTVKYNNPDASQMPEDMITYFGGAVSFTLHCPGPVVDSNGTDVSGTTVTWKYPMKEFSTIQEKEFRVTYKLEPGAAGSSTTPSAGTPAAGATKVPPA